ncbi:MULTISPECIES: PLP-dependent aminotransferase family protein [unclassified Streptomyces]|uniref:aminotransferase-like domain-containing protein n=1 Tax=unclassified Streptomyces TaxID=2593676 RepID=UPI003826D323
MTALDRSRLHASLSDPVLSSVEFLNEVMRRYPDAISFAPGAPHPDSYADLDVERHLGRFLDYLVTELGHPPAMARRMLYEYGPSRGLIDGLIADLLRRDHGVDAPPQAVVVTVGAQEAMLLALRALMRSDDDLLAVADPCYVGITGAARLLGVEMVPIPEIEEGLHLEALSAACRATRRTGRRVRVCSVAPDFSNPGGNRMSMERRERLLELAAAEDFLILEDNVYGFTAAPGDELPSLKALDRSRRVVHLGTFAKVCFPGARVGYVVADQTVRTADGGTTLLADELARLKTMVTVNTSPLSQAVVGGMLLENGGSLAARCDAHSTLYRRNLALLLDRLDRLRDEGLPPEVTWNRPAGGFFVRMRLPIPVDEDLLARSAASYGVLWTPMAPFHLGPGGADVLRLSCSYLDARQIITGVERLGAFLRGEVRG